VTECLLCRLLCQLAYLSDSLMVGLEHAPPNFDVKSRLLGPGVSCRVADRRSYSVLWRGYVLSHAGLFVCVSHITF